jgi:hypothetical protein
MADSDKYKFSDANGFYEHMDIHDAYCYHITRSVDPSVYRCVLYNQCDFVIDDNLIEDNEGNFTFIEEGQVKKWFDMNPIWKENIYNWCNTLASIDVKFNFTLGNGFIFVTEKNGKRSMRTIHGIIIIIHVFKSDKQKLEYYKSKYDIQESNDFNDVFK